MFLAFLRACGAYLGAYLAERIRKPASDQQEFRRRSAGSGTFHIQPDAGRQVGHRFFFETGVGALDTHPGTMDTGVDARIIFLIGHKNFLALE
jgi:hypothetical protein